MMQAKQQSTPPPAKKNAAGVVVGGDISVDLYPFIRRYKDGRVERLLSSTFVPASEDLAGAGGRGVVTRDVVIDHGTGVRARLFLPSHATAAATAAGSRRLLPLVVYIHGGAFCTESAFCRTYHRYATSLTASAGAVLVSVEYRLAPEFPVPAAYDDAWAALRWVASMSDPWLADYADPARTFLVGDSAGGNIAYHTAVRAAGTSRGGTSMLDIQGLVMVQPYFWGVDRLPSEEVGDGLAIFPANDVDRHWAFVTDGMAGNDDPRLHPPDADIASLACRSVLVAVAGKDTLRDRGRLMAGRVRGVVDVDVKLVESEGEDHGFHLYSPLRATSRKLMESLVQFINHQTPSPSPATVFPELQLHGWEGKTSSAQPRKSTMKVCSGSCTRKTIYGTIFAATVRRPNKVHLSPMPTMVSGSCALNSFF